MKSENQMLTAKVTDLQEALAERRHHRTREAIDLNKQPAVDHVDPASDAELQLHDAEKAISQGNLGSAVDDCKAAAADIQTASNSTSRSVRDAVGGLKIKLDDLDQQTSALLKKLGA